jgi:hypothetical protein
MAVNELQWSFQSNDRQCKVIYNQLFTSNCFKVDQYSFDISTQKRQITNIILSSPPQYITYNGMNTHVFIDKKKTSDFFIDCTNQSLLDIEEFSWISKNNHRLCFFVWMFIRATSMSTGHCNIPFNRMQTNIFPTEELNPQFNKHIYKEMTILQSPSSTAERRQAIIDFFDLLGTDIFSKRSILENIRQKWSQVNASNPIDWADEKNHVQGETLLNKLKSLRKNCEFLNAIGQPDAYWGTLAYFDCFVSHPDTREVLVGKLKAAWNSKKNSLKDEERKKDQFNFKMDIGLHELLDELVVLRKTKSKNELVESIIRDAYENAKNDTGS